mgnify:CR=1 FL=1
MTGKNLLAALAFAALAVTAFPAAAAKNEGREMAPAQQYKNCMALARRNPEKAFGAALAWRDMDGLDGAKAIRRSRPTI